jgi:Protein of unknown function (DUF3105)
VQTPERHQGRTLLLALTLVAGGCSSSSDTGNATPDSGTGDGGAQCQVERLMPPSEGAGHTTLCGPTSYNSKPPSSGTHYGTWPVFRAYDQPVPWGFLVHGLEHGAVVIAYNCPDGCAAEVQAAREVMAAAPARPGCPRAPVILTPDPTLDVRFAAAAWGHVLRAPCFDRQAFGDFIAERRDKGPENIPNDCGASDREAIGWCPP